MRLPELDGLRGVAILSVVLWHFVGSRWSIVGAPAGDAVVAGLRLSWSGVDLFFVLSGFLIGGILIDHRDSPGYFRSFYGRRVCRIFPLYYLLLLIFVVGVELEARGSGGAAGWLFRGRAPLWTYFTFTQNLWMADTGSWGARFNSVTWSLAIEEQFYLVLPLVVRFVPPRWLSGALGALVVAAVVFRNWAFVSLDHSGLACYFLPLCRFDALCLGALAANLLRRPAIASALRAARGAQATVLAVLFVGVVGMTWADYRIRSEEMSRWGYSWLALFFLSLLLFAVTQPDSLIARASRFAPLRQLGTISYGVYSLHQIVDRLAFTWLRDQPGTLKTWADLGLAAATFGATLALAAVSWKFFEKPILTWGQRFRYASAPIAPLKAGPVG